MTELQVCMEFRLVRSASILLFCFLLGTERGRERLSSRHLRRMRGNWPSSWRTKTLRGKIRFFSLRSLPLLPIHALCLLLFTFVSFVSLSTRFCLAYFVCFCIMAANMHRDTHTKRIVGCYEYMETGDCYFAPTSVCAMTETRICLQK